MTPTSASPALSEADQAMREALTFACNDPGYFAGFKGNRSLGQWQADALLAGPLATLRAERDQLAAELREAREERDSMVAWAKSSTMACDKAYIALTAEEGNLIALAKLYGEACSELQVLRALAQDVADEADDAEYDGFLLTPDPHQAAGSASGKEETDADRR